ncbi:hypothetical protein FALBO_12389 [Fusarium albosuccineum]|uniref:Transcription factor hoxa13 n=1 Tax=Fusarium albosuccineum TaxID=1237068 RepID=A0A8H4P366_9HYPO|nr:hypothetical protein FALBO_12389 [Fusarium albosuccineum]
MAESAGSIMNGNGHLNGKANGNHIAGRRRPVKQRRSFLAWTFSVVARLTAWAAILTVLFRCPESLEACDETSPAICQHYFQIKNTVSPHVQPYYDQYAAPYVEIARPYYETVDNKVWQPARAYAMLYGAPWAEKARDQVLSQWEKNGQPQLAKYQSLAQAQYDQSVGPYVNQAGEALGPYYEIARTNGLQVYYEYLRPGYEFVQPYAVRGYDTASEFTTTTALPTAYWAWNKTYAFLDSSVWPHLRVVYVKSVEPQLVRIGERLGRYKSKAKPIQDGYSSSVTETTTSSFQKPAPQSTTTVESSSEAPVATESPEPVAEPVSQDYINPVQAPPPTENESEKRRKAREMVAKDLETWQTKFASQADEGANDLETRVDEIAQRMIQENVKTTGKQLFDDLESTIDSELKGLRTKISSLAASEEKADVDDQIVAAVRSAGMAIKTKAQAIRQWREGYDKELQNTVITVADVHFQVLDETRNLALQQIGMRWAWTDGITYKDWAKYHELKSTLNEWTEQLKQLIVTHPSLLTAQDASAQVEDEGMEIASVAAKELARLKQVARWKVAAGDATDNFDSDAMQLAAEEAVKEPEVVEEQTPAEEDNAASSLSASVEEATSQAHEVEQELEDFVSSVAEPAKEEVSSVVDAEPNVIDEATSAVSDTIKSVVSDASSLIFEGEESASSIADEASETVDTLSSAGSESASSVIEEVSSELSEVIESATSNAEPESEDSSMSTPLASEASEVLMGDTASIVSNGSDEPVPADDEPLVEIEEDPLTHRDETPLSDEHQHIKPAFLGAAAQEVPHRQVVLDDYVDTDLIASATDAAQSAYSNAVSRASEQYSSALSVVSAQIYGTPKPVHEQLLSSVSSSYDQALSAAGDQLNKAVEAATTAAQELPATATVPNWVDWERVESIASQRLNEGRLWAEIQYQSALIAMGLATPTPSSSAEKYYEQAKLNYYAGLGIAQDRYASFIAGAAAALSSLTATPTPTDFAGSASSVASVARESAASAAQAAGEAAGSAYSAAGDTVKSAAKAVDDSVSSVVDAANEQISSAGLAIAESWGEIVEQISGRVYGEPTQIAWYEHIWSDAGSYAAAATDAAADKASVASDAAAASAVTASAEAAKQFESVSNLVSELISGKEPSFTESVLSRLQAAYATAAANVESLASEANEAAASVGEKVGSAASQATEAVKETFQHARDEL